MSTHAPTRKILILVAEPTDAARLRLGRELREIQLGLRQSVDRDRFEISHLLAVQPADLRREVLNARPRPEVVHFCGHGAGRDGLVLEDDQGKARLVPTDALAELFRLFDPDVRCVVLNSCYSATQAAEIVRHIDYVVGMKQAIGDEAAIEFSRGFYDALFAGESYERAFAFGCSAIQLESLAGEAVPQAEPRDLAPVETPVDRLPEHLKPVLLKRSDTGSTPPPTPPGWRLSWGRRTIVTLSLLVALVLGIGILGVLFRGGCGQDQGGDDDDGPVVAAAAGLANAYDQPRGSLPDPPGPNTNYYRLRQAVFLATRAWRAEKPLLAQALEQLRRSRFFEARAYPDAPEDFPKLLAEVDNILAVRLGWLKDAVLPALLRTGQPQSIPVPREARFDFRPEPGAEPAERFSRIVEVQEEIRLIEAARR